MNGLSDVEILTGLGYAGSAEQSNTLMGAFNALPDERKKAAITALKTTNFGSLNKNVRDLVLERASQLPVEILEGLVFKRLQIVESELYSTKLITNKGTQVFFEDADTIKEGVTNVNNAKLKKDQWFLCCGIQMTAGTGTADDPKDAPFGAIETLIANGDFDLEANGGKKLLDERTPCNIFTDIPAERGGFRNKKWAHAFDNPKWIEPQVNIKTTVRFADTVATAHRYVKVKLIGASIIPY